MKKNILSVMAVGLSIGLAAAAEPTGFKSNEEKASYLIGYNIGSSVKRDGFAVTPEKLIQGLTDGMKGKPSAFSQEQASQIMMALQQSIAMKRQAASGDTHEEGTAFLAANKKKAGVKTTASGLQYKVIKSGKGATPKADSKVTTHYRGTLIDGTEFDSSYSRNAPASFPVNGVIKGWTEALLMMKEGDKWQLFIPTELAYGARSPSPKIPSMSALVFEIELLKVN